MMNDLVYDMPIRETAEFLDKSDRQVRRYVKAERLKARPVRVDGHIKLMFNRDQVIAFREALVEQGAFGESGREVVVDARLLEEESGEARQADRADRVDSAAAGASDPVKYVIDALREQIEALSSENRDLHYQLEQRSGQVGFLQGRIETLQEELKMLAPAPQSQEEIVRRKPWYRRIFRG